VKDFLNESDLRTIRDALNYAVQKVNDYPHMEHNHKRDSLRPIEAARDKVRALIAARKEATDGTHSQH
jgi:selenocysteine lyase/cysteine desulfurase